MVNREYDSESLDRSLPPPPRIHPLPDNLPIIEPPFRNHVAPHREEAEEWEVVETTSVSSEELMVLTEDMLLRVREVVLSSERVLSLLPDKRYIAIGASLRESKERDASPSILFVLYDYAENQAIDVWLDSRSLEVTDIQTALYQPAPVQEEIDQAIDLARRDERLASRLTEDLTGMAILVTVDDPFDPLSNHRLFDIRFGCSDERLPRYSALVDLSTDTVIRTGIVDKHCGEANHE